MWCTASGYRAGGQDGHDPRTHQHAGRAGRQAGTLSRAVREFCGLSHALMAFDVIAMPPAAFDAWLANEARPARPSDAEGARLFAANGCGGCHTVAGVTAPSRIGPDLTHFGSRRTLAAGILPMTPANVAAFIRHPKRPSRAYECPPSPNCRMTRPWPSPAICRACNEPPRPGRSRPSRGTGRAAT